MTHLRTESSRTLDNHDGTFEAQLFTDPLFYRATDSDEWLPIDLSFEASTAPGVAANSTRAPVAVSLGRAEMGKPFLTLSHRGQSIGFSLSADLVPAAPLAPTLEGARADFALRPGLGLRVFRQAYGTKSFVVLDGPPSVAAFTFLVEAPGLNLEARPDGSAVFRDAKGAEFASMPRPYMVDSSSDPRGGGGRVSEAVTLTVAQLAGATAITLTPDPGWLATASYPVYVDPSVVIYNNGATSYGDAHVSQRSPTTNYGNYKRPDSPGYYEMWLGEDPTDATNYNEAYILYDLSQIMGTTIDTATLEVRPYHQYYNAPTSTTTWLRRVTTGAWVESGTGGITWNTKPGITSTGTVTAACVEGQQCGFNVASLVQG